MATANARNLRKSHEVQGAIELGPRSLALLRRIVMALEKLAETEGGDLGDAFESDDVTWAESTAGQGTL